MSINYVKSVVDNDCVPACLAMVTNTTLEYVLNSLQPYWLETGQFDGVDYPIAAAWLASQGYAMQPIDHDFSPKQQLIQEWPIKPWAPAHLVYVFDKGSHCVVMDNSGWVLDPNDITISSLNQYYRIYSVVGIWKVSDQLLY